MTPLVIAHRGASGEAPENTLKAFRLAKDQGADGIELDVFLSKDGEMVVTHDENLKKLTGKNVWTRNLTLAELKQLDFGEGEKIPTLEEVLEQFGSAFKIINIEIKTTGFFTDGIEKAVIPLIQKFNLTEKIVLSSFNPLHLLRCKKLAPEIKRATLMFHRHWPAQRPFWTRWVEASQMNLEARWYKTPSVAKRYNKLQKPIWVWTVNEEEEMKYWIQKGVAGIITNYPGRLRSLLRQK